MAIARAIGVKTRSVLILGLVLALFATSLIVLQVAAAAGTPLLAIGIDVVSGSSSQVTYRINVRNEGNDNATDVRVSMPVPGNGTFGNTTFESSEPDASPVAGSLPGAAPTCDDGGEKETATRDCQWALGTLVPRSLIEIDVTLNLVAPPTDTSTSANRLLATATVTGKNPSTNADLSASNIDDSLTRERLTISHDAYVDAGKPTGTNYGACPSLTIAGGNLKTAYLDATDTDMPTPATNVEKMLGAELHMNVVASDYSEAAPGSLGLFPIQSNWMEGAGGCDGAIGQAPEARTGSPITTGPQTSIASVKAANSTVRWDVTSDLDGGAERAAFQGWQIRNLSGAGSVGLHSKEAADAFDPKIVMIYAQPESGRCIDVDPENRSDHPTSEQVVTAVVTDGTNQPAGSSKLTAAGGSDACNGTPVSGVLVSWNLDDDSPDIYISNQGGTQVPQAGTTTDATPESTNTSTDASGKTFIGIRLGNSLNWSGENRVAGCIANSTAGSGTCAGTGHSAEPPEGDNKTQCDLGSPLGTNCAATGESQHEDDVRLTWSNSATPDPGDTTPPPSGPPTIAGFSPTAGPVGTNVIIDGSNFTGTSAVRFNGTAATFTVNSPTRISTFVPTGATDGPISVQNPQGTTLSAGNFDVTPRASSSPSPTNTATSPGSSPGTTSPGTTASPSGLSPVTLTLASSAEQTVAFTEVTLSGALGSNDPACAQPGTTIEILEREAESTTFEHLAYTDTKVGGLFEYKVTPEANTFYSALIGQHATCESGAASPITVLISPKVSIKSTATTVERGRRFWITGSVLPEHQLTAVKIFRKTGPGQWDKVGKDFLDASSRYSLSLKYTWKRKVAIFIARWKATDADHVSGKSARLKITRLVPE